MTRPAAPPPPDLSERPRADLDALTALLAAAKAAAPPTGPEWEGPDWYEAADFWPDEMDYEPAVFIAAANPLIVISLIEAARREEALVNVIARAAQMIEPDYDVSDQGGRRWIDVDRAYALLHDNAGATGAAGSGPE